MDKETELKNIKINYLADKIGVSDKQTLQKMEQGNLIDVLDKNR